MYEQSRRFKHRQRESFLALLSAGFFFILVGAIFFSTPNLFDKIIAFFTDFSIEKVPNINIQLLAPESPGDHSTLYRAVMQFSFVWGLFQVVFLVLRVLAQSPLTKTVETVSNIVSWLGASLLIYMFLSETTTIGTWFAFWATIIMLIGVSLLVRGIILAAATLKS